MLMKPLSFHIDSSRDLGLFASIILLDIECTLLGSSAYIILSSSVVSSSISTKAVERDVEATYENNNQKYLIKDSGFSEGKICEY